MKKIVVAAMIVGIAAIAGTALAATVSSNFDVTATVVTSCRISTSASTVAFGSYDPTNPAPNDVGSGSAGFRCTRGTTYRTYIAGARTMTNGADNLTFELYSDIARTTVYPSTFAASSDMSSLSNAEVTSSYYGRVPALQDVPAGAYTATLTFTVEY